MPSISMERLSPLANVSSNPCLDGGEAHLQESCLLDGLPNASNSSNRSTPEILSDQGHGRIQHVQHQEPLCWNEGCNRQAKAGPTSQEGEIDLFCSDHQSTDVIATRTAHCQFTGCFNIPKYGQQKGPLKFCQHHKRAGMYTNRTGQILLATRDGSAFNNEDGTEAVSAASSTLREEIQHNAAGDGITDFGRNGGEPTPPASKLREAHRKIGLRGSLELAGLGPSCAQVKTPSRTVGVTAATPQYRKMCEVTGCRTQPSYGSSGTSRPRFCSKHKKEGMVGLKNRPCGFPGCNTRPHYGLLGSRPIYCAKHKEANMVHLLKEATIREKMDATRDLGKTIGATAESIRSGPERLMSVTRSKERQLKRKGPKNTATYQVKGDEELDSREGIDGLSLLPLPPLREKQKQGGKETGKGGIECQRKTTSLIPTASCSSTSTSIPASKESTRVMQIATVSAQVTSSTNGGDPGKCVNASGGSSLPEKTPNSRLASTLDMTPSLEMQVLKDIRESAQEEVTSSGSGRRARVPSRKALEASGKLKNEDTQWLTKEKKEEESRRMKKFRAQRKAAAAAGLRAGQVIEAVTIGPTSGAGSDDRVGEITKSEPAKMMWRKLSPVEIMEVAARKPISSVIEMTRTGEGGELASGAEHAHNGRWKDVVKDATSGTSGGKRKEIAWVHQGTTKVSAPRSDTTCLQHEKRRKEQMKQVMPSPDRRETRQVSGWGSTGRSAGNVEAGEVDGMQICQFEDCSKRATFGVNGTVRYCKLHALFGMHRIDAPT